MHGRCQSCMRINNVKATVAKSDYIPNKNTHKQISSGLILGLNCETFCVPICIDTLFIQTE